MGGGGKTSAEAPRVSPHLGCQGLLRLDMLNDYNNLEYNLDLVHNLRPGYNFMF